MEDFLNSLRTQEKLQPEPSYAQQLEKQKEILLKQREIDDLKKLTADMKVWCQQLEVEDRCLLEQANKSKALCLQVDELKMEVQSVIDQNIVFTLDNLRESCRRRNALDEQHSRKRQVIVKMKQQLEQYEGLLAQMRESKGQTLMKKVQEEVEEENNKLQKIRSEIDNIQRARNIRNKQDWDKKKKMFVEMGELWMQIKTQEEKTATVRQNNGLLKTRITQLDDEIELQRQKQEADIKRRNNELNERIMNPLKIVHANGNGNAFKNPNDFPILIGKVQARRSYEHIFKRPEYMKLHNSKTRGREIKPSNGNKSSSRQSQPTDRVAMSIKITSQQTKHLKSSIANTAMQNKTTAGGTFISDTETKPIGQQKQKKLTLPKKIRPENTTVKNTDPSVKRKICYSENSSKEQTIPVSSPQKIKEQTDSSQLQPMSASAQKTVQPEYTATETTKNISEESKLSENLNKHKNSENQSIQVEAKAIVPLLAELDEESDIVPDEVVDVVPSARKDGKQYPETMKTGQHPSEVTDSKSNDKGIVHSDAISLSSTISSLDLENREHSSDLGFDLSPIASRKGNSAIGSDDGGSGDLDFDFLSDSPKQSAEPQKRKKNDFDFFTANNDSSFDFF